MDIFLFIAAILSMLATAAIIHLVCKHTKLKALVTGITFQPIKQTEALIDKESITQNCTAQWYTTAALTLIGHRPHNIYFYNHTKVHNI